MKDLQKLAQELLALDDKLSACMKCGTCQSVCPIFGETMMEADVTRGKLALLSNLSHKITADSKAVRAKLDRCLLCGSCQAGCPSGVSILDIFMKAREISATYMGLPIIKKIIFRCMLCNPRLFNFLMRFGRPFHPLFMYDDKNLPHTACAPLMKPFMGDRHVPIMPKKTICQKYGVIDTPAGKSGLKVVFFPGCMGDKVYTNVTEACLKIFEKHGVGVYVADNFACCGIPALASGDTKSFKTMLRLNVDILKDKKFDYIVTACSSCTETIHKFWVDYSKEMKCHNDAIAIGKKAVDINAFLVDVLKVQPVENQAREKKSKVTYHDSCHLMKSLGVSKQPRELIKMNANCEFVEMREADRCCGCGGSFTLTHYDLSRKIGKRKRDNIISANADVVACGCPACMMQISNMLALDKDAVEVKHVAEIYADSLK